jgi:5-formyltetrahydrofolate cyclo-ligase
LGPPEPKAGCPETPREISLAVPCFCCDRNGNRLGYSKGKGYYDRYLPL